MNKFELCFFAALCCMLVACDNNNPGQNKLLGTWSEPLGIHVSVNALTFNADGIAVYANIPDTTMSVYPTGGVIYGQMNYVVEKDKLCFIGNGVRYDETGLPIDTVPFEYASVFSITGNILTIDSFAYDGGIMTQFIKPLIFYKY